MQPPREPLVTPLSTSPSYLRIILSVVQAIFSFALLLAVPINIVFSGYVYPDAE